MRRPGERILIGDDIIINVNDISGNQVILGIDAPKHINIIRSELIGRTPKESKDDNEKNGNK